MSLAQSAATRSTSIAPGLVSLTVGDLDDMNALALDSVLSSRKPHVGEAGLEFQHFHRHAIAAF